MYGLSIGVFSCDLGHSNGPFKFQILHISMLISLTWLHIRQTIQFLPSNLMSTAERGLSIIISRVDLIYSKVQISRWNGVLQILCATCLIHWKQMHIIISMACLT